MPDRYAKRLGEIAPFRVMKLLARANELESLGNRIIHMEVGEPDFATAEPIVRAGLAAMSAGKTRYTPALGIPSLREAVSHYYETDYGLSVDPERIVITAGASGALLLISALLLNAGEGLLMADPGYPCNRHFQKTFGGEGQLVPVTFDDNYQLSGHRVRTAWQSNTRGVLLASPSNPTGSICAARDMLDISTIVKSNSGFLVVDEIYHGLCYTARQPKTVLSIDKDAFVVNSFSKYFGMTGWRLGWMVMPPDAAADIEKLAQNLFICPSSIAQYAALAAFTGEAREIMDSQREEFRRRRDFLVPALREIGFGIPRMPDGAFYVYAKVPEFVDDSESLCERLLEKHFVAVTPGTDFGTYLARDHVRFSYAQNIALLEEGVERVATALGDWEGR